MSKDALNGLLALGAITNAALAGDELPTRLKLLNWGVNPSIKGPIKVGDQTVAALSANQKAFGYDRVGIDYNHQSLPGHPNFKPDPREMAAYGVPAVVPGEGLFLEDIAWTPSGRQYARNYSDLSPTPLLDAGEVTFLHSVALCPQGCVEGLSFFSADFPPADKTTKKPMNEELKKLLAALFGVADTATEEELLTAGKAYVETQAKKTGATPEVTALSAGILELTNRFDEQQREAIIAQAVRDGKLVPNSAKGLPVAQLKAIVDELTPNQVPLEKRTPEGVQALSASISASDIAVAKQLGLTPEEFAKTK